MANRKTQAGPKEERIVIVPEELENALLMDSSAATIFAALPYSHKKEYADWISSAKQPETRARRVATALTMLVARGRR